MANPDLVLQETGSRPTYSRLNYVPSGDTLRRDAISSYIYLPPGSLKLLQLHIFGKLLVLMNFYALQYFLGFGELWPTFE